MELLTEELRRRLPPPLGALIVNELPTAAFGRAKDERRPFLLAVADHPLTGELDEQDFATGQDCGGNR